MVTLKMPTGGILPQKRIREMCCLHNRTDLVTWVAVICDRAVDNVIC